MVSRPPRLLFVVIVLGLLLHGSNVRAADTWETYPTGATDFEFYLGFDGIGQPKFERSIWGGTQVGYGIIDRFSGFVSLSGATNEYFSAGSSEATFALFGTPLDTRWIDLDLFLMVTLGGPGLSELTLLPMLELNFNGHPDMKSWGLYLRLAERIGGRDESTPDDPTTPVDEFQAAYSHTFATHLTFGVYYTIRQRHQLLLEYDMTFDHTPESGARKVNLGGIALGYNVTLCDGVELINQLRFDVPQSGEKFGVSVMIGVFITLPGSRRPKAGGKKK